MAVGIGKYFISSKWRYPRVVLGFFVAELATSIPILALFAIADPNEYRTRLWQDGSQNGFNSNPNQVLYDYANHRPVNIPLVWSQFLTDYNVAIAVLSTFLLLVKAVLFVLHIWYPILSFPIHAGLTAVWAYSVYGQTSPDMSDPAHPQPGAPWYITKSCSVAHSPSNIPFCEQAKASLAISVLMMALFAANTVWAVYSMFPSEKQKQKRREKLAEKARMDEEGWDAEEESEWSWRLQNMPKTPATASMPLSPTTPRTKAFRALNG